MTTTRFVALAFAALICTASARNAVGDTFGSDANTFDIAFVAIGDPGNAADTTGYPNPAGSVPYEYRIGTYEVSRDMITKANTLGSLEVTLNDMSSFGGNGVNRPATGVSWNEAARFVNWLNISTGSTPAYKFAVQPGEVGYNSNDNIELWTPSDAGYNPNNLFRNGLASYFLPSDNEWYKAAYYDPTSGVYYDYPTGSNAAPAPVASGTAANTAVYNMASATGPADIALAGGLSRFGTRGQGGNVWEWEETDSDLVNDSTSSYRGLRGGTWINNSSGYLLATNFNFDTPTGATSFIGFRVASIPEPGTLLLAALAGSGLLLRRRSLLCASIMAVGVLISVADTAAAVTIDMVTVGNPGNAADMRYNLLQRPEGYGAVPYLYRIGKYEVTAGQYTEFLNAVAKDDPNGLHSTGDFLGGGAHIVQSGVSPNYSYSVAADWANLPVNYVNFWDAVRFANWLHNGQPIGAQGPGTTESGAYHDVGNGTLFGRNPGAKFFIPTEDEWYKAAYHDKTAGLSASYFEYPTGTNAVPGRDMAESTNSGNNANYASDTLLIGSPYYRTPVGEFELSDSPYGTFDQGGNILEWNETKNAGSSRGVRGGSFVQNTDGLRAISPFYLNPAAEDYYLGFRVASIPEPSTLLLGALAGMGLLWRRALR